MSLIHKTFEELFNAIADAIREKENSSNEIIADNFPARIRGLSASGGGINTFDATATANDIALGTSAYVQGVKVNGSIPIVTDMQPNATSGNYMASSVSGNQIQINFNYTNPSRMIVEAGTSIRIGAILPEFGTVQPADVIKDQTFTSTAGLKKKGTFTLDSEVSEQELLIQQIQEALVGKSAGTGITLPTLSNPGAAEDLAWGKQLIGADGSVVNGTVYVTDSNMVGLKDYTAVGTGTSGDVSHICNEYKFTSSQLFRKGSGISINVPFEAYGSATAADVAVGKTFTSAAGLKVTGTAEKSQPTVGVGSHSGSGYYISENAEGTLKPVTVPSDVFVVSGVVNLTEQSSGDQFSMHNLYLDTKLNLANTVSFFIPSLAQYSGLVSVYGFRDNEGWTIYFYGVNSGGGVTTIMMRSDEMLIINHNDRIQYQGNMFTTSFVDSGKIPLLPFSTVSTVDSANVLAQVAFMSDIVNYNGITAGPDIIITYTE